MSLLLDNIVLIGMAGAGKSTVGVVLAKTLGYGFMDSDILIQEREQMLLQEIIDKKGMDPFIQAESSAIETIDVKATVIATGGSAVYSKKAMKHLQKIGTIVYLDVAFEEIEKRISNITTRGIAIAKGRTLREVYDERQALYEAYGDLHINCEGKTVEMIIDEIISRIRL